MCMKAGKILGLLYWRFYNNSDGSTLLKLYLSLVRPHLEYASPVWNLHMHKYIKLPENVKNFAIQMIIKRWDCGYQELLDMVTVQYVYVVQDRSLYIVITWGAVMLKIKRKKKKRATRLQMVPKKTGTKLKMKVM